MLKGLSKLGVGRALQLSPTRRARRPRAGASGRIEGAVRVLGCPGGNYVGPGDLLFLVGSLGASIGIQVLPTTSLGV